ISTGAASGLHAIGYGAQLIRAGRAAALMAGGAEELCFESFYGFLRANLLSRRDADRPGCAVPFDARRSGCALGEGAAFVVLESEQTGRLRGIVGLEDPDPAIDLDLVAVQPRPIRAFRALVTASAVEGNCCALVVSAG